MPPTAGHSRNGRTRIGFGRRQRLLDVFPGRSSTVDGETGHQRGRPTPAQRSGERQVLVEVTGPQVLLHHPPP